MQKSIAIWYLNGHAYYLYTTSLESLKRKEMEEGEREKEQWETRGRDKVRQNEREGDNV